MNYQTNILTISKFDLHSGQKLLGVNACYTLYGDFNNKKNLALFFHGFSSNSELHTWWEKFKFNKMLKSYNIICINSLGSSYGTTGPDSIDPLLNAPYWQNFPQINIQDTVNFSVTVLQSLGITEVDLVLGCSLGGMQALDLFLRYPEMSKKFISVAGTPVPYITKLINLAQARLIDQAISDRGNRNDLEKNLGLSRFFFRLSCTTEKALEVLLKNRKSSDNKTNQALGMLENYFVKDNLKFQTQFSPYSNSLYLKLIANFEIPEIMPKRNHPKLILVSIQDDSFTPEKYVQIVYHDFSKKGYEVQLRRFETIYGHEAWIIDGERFYDFIEKDINFDNYN